MNKMFSSKQVQHVLPEAEATSVPNDKADLSSPPKGIVNSNQNVGSAPIPDTFAHANENDNDKASNDNVPLHAVQNNETVRESDVEVSSLRQVIIPIQRKQVAQCYKKEMFLIMNKM